MVFSAWFSQLVTREKIPGGENNLKKGEQQKTSESPAGLTGQRVRLRAEILVRLQNSRHPNTSAE